MAEGTQDTAAAVDTGTPAAAAAADSAAAPVTAPAVTDAAAKPDGTQAAADALAQVHRDALTAALVLPQDSPLDPAKSVARVLAWADQHKVAPEIAKAVLEMEHTEVADALVQYEAARAPGGVIHKATVEKFAGEALKHPQLGNGDPAKFEQVQQQVGLVLGKYGSTGLAEDIKARGYMTPNEMLFLAAVYQAQGESAFVSGAGTTVATDAPWEKRMFPSGIPDHRGAKVAL